MIGYYLQLAWLRCRKTTATTCMIVITLAIGIAAFMTSLTIVAAFTGEPLPGISSHLYVVTMDAREAVQKDPSAYTTPNSLLRLLDAKALVDAAAAGAWAAIAENHAEVSAVGASQSTGVWGLEAYGPVLQEFGVRLLHGRTWTHREQVSHVPVAVIDSRLATKLFGATDAIGRTIEINKHPFRVIGVVLPWRPRIRFIDLVGQGGTVPTPFRLFLPLGAALDAHLWPFGTSECDNNETGLFGALAVNHCGSLETWVKLSTPAEVAGYQRFVANYAGTQHAAGRFVYPPQAKLYRTRAWVDLNHVVPSDVSLDAMLAGAFLVLCMATVTSLLTARFVGRRTDTAIRRALGASRIQILAQHLVEAGLLGFLGGLLALPLTLFGVWVVHEQPASYAAAAHFNWDMLVVLMLLSLAVSLAVGIVPGWRACHVPPAMQIRQT